METYQGTTPQYYYTMTKVHYPSKLHFLMVILQEPRIMMLLRPISENVASGNHYLGTNLNYENSDSK